MKTEQDNSGNKIILMCDVPNCDQPMLYGWIFKHLIKKVCLYHRRRDNSKQDQFSLLTVFGMSRYEGIKLDHFGCPIPPDTDRMKKVAASYAEERREESIERLRKWKDGQRPPPKKKFNERRDYERTRKPELDDVVARLLNGD